MQAGYCPRIENGKRINEARLKLSRFSIGSVPFLNAAPLTFGIEDMVDFLPPNQLAQKFRRGEIDAALLSITEFFESEKNRLITPYGICSDGPVKSVFLAHQDPLHEIDTIYVDPASLTSVQLLKFILDHYGISPNLIPFDKDYSQANQYPNVLLIGNPAIHFKFENPSHEIIDLGLEWQKITKHPFVYAGWVVREDKVHEDLEDGLKLIAEQGLIQIEDIKKFHPDFTFDFRNQYLNNAILYHLGDLEWKGIEIFKDFFHNRSKNWVSIQ